MKRSFTAILLVIIGLVVLFTFSNLNTIEVSGQSQQPTTLLFQTSKPSPTGTSTAAPISTSTATLTLDQQAGDLLKTYQEVLNVSKGTVEDVHRTFDWAIALIGVAITILSLGGYGAISQISSYAKRASDKAASAENNSTRALDTIKKIEEKTADLEKINSTANNATKELVSKQNDLRKQIENSEKALKVLQNEIDSMKNLGEQDRQVIKRPLALMQIDDHSIQLLSGSAEKKNGSVVALIEMSARPDAAIRRRSVRALGILEEYDERVVKRMKEIITADSVQGVRKEAEKTLKLIEAKKPKKKTTRRKS